MVSYDDRIQVSLDCGAGDFGMASIPVRKTGMHVKINDQFFH
jgi:hypothetical protein